MKSSNAVLDEKTEPPTHLRKIQEACAVLHGMNQSPIRELVLETIVCIIECEAPATCLRHDNAARGAHHCS